MDKNLFNLSDTSFPVYVIEHLKTSFGSIFPPHFHEHQLQLFYFTQGKATIYCNGMAYELDPPDILLINKGELHYGENMSPELRYYVFRIDLDLLSAYGVIPCVQKYLDPLGKSLILFENQVNNKAITDLLEKIILESRNRESGYELALLSCALNIIEELFRHHVETSYAQQEAELLMKKRERFMKVFEYIETNYKNTIRLDEAAGLANMSEGYFCRTFKQSTGRTLTDYVNRLRLEKAVVLLNQGQCNITEAAISVGFDDVNYFSRVFQKFMKQSPSSYLNGKRRYFI